MWTIQNITANAAKGDLLVVVGHVGAGKVSTYNVI